MGGCDKEHIERRLVHIESQLARILDRLVHIEALIERILAEFTRPPPKTPRRICCDARYQLIFESGEHLGRDMPAARKLRQLLVGAAVTHDPGLARRVAALRRDSECPLSARRLWTLLRYQGGIPPDEK